MPLLEATDTQGRGFSPQQDAPVAPQKPLTVELWDAAMRDNPIVSIGDYAKESFDRSQITPIDGYDPFNDVQGYETEANSFVDVNSPNELEAVKRKIDDERKARETIANGGAEGIAVSLAAGILDPTILIPGAVGIKALRTGKALSGAIEAGAAGLVASSISEGTLQATQETRTASESALNIAASTILSGALGGAAGALARKEIPGALSLDEMERNIGQELGLPVSSSSVGAKVARDTTLEQEGVKSALGVERLSKGNYVVGTPLSRGLSSPSVETRRIVGDLAETKLIQNKNSEGIPSLPSVEQRVRSWQGPLAEALGEIDVNYTQYRFGRTQENPINQSNFAAFRDTVRLGANNMRDLVSGSDGKLTYQQFKEEIGKAMRNGDEHPIPEVSASAKSMRENLFDPLKNEAIAARMLPEDVSVTTAPSYLTRLYDVPRIVSRRPEFEGRLSDWLGGLRDSSARSADARASVDVDSKIAKALQEERVMASLTDAEIGDIAREITDKLIGGTQGRISYGAIPLARGPLKERTLNIPDAMIEDFLHSDIEHVARAYARTMSTDVELTKKFGRADMEEQIAQINDSYARLRKDVASEKELKKLEARRQTDIRDVQGMRDRIRGTYAMPDDPSSLLVRAGRSVRDLNYMRLLGGMTISSASDAARPVMIHGMARVMKSGIVPLIKGAKIYKVAAKEAKLAGTALDMVLDTRAMQIADVFDDYGRYSKLETGIKAASDRFGLVSAMAPWNAFWKQFSGVVGQTRNMQAITALKSGKATKAEIERLAFLGIGREQADRIADEFAKHGKKDSGVWWANTGDWTDREAVDAFRNALAKEIDLTIVSPGQDKPLWMSTEMGKIISQFRSFTMASMTQVTTLGLQRRDAAFLQGLVLSVGLGMLAMVMRKMAAGHEIPDDPTQWITEGVDRSGITGWVTDVNSIAEKVTRNQIGLARLTGKPSTSRYASRNAVGALLGPTFGTVSDAFQVTGAAMAGDWTAGDTSKVRQLVPYQNVFYLRRLFNKMEEGANDAIGVPQRKR